MKKIFPAVLFSLCVLFGLVLQAAETAQTIEVGRVLDKEAVSGQTPDVSSGAFTVAMRFRPLGQGVEEFSGRGMLFSVASGYYEGFRAHYGNAAQDVIFEIGIPELRHSISARTQASAPLGVLSDLVCTYDGAVMKIYLNGEEAASQATDVKIETKNAPLRVGYVNYGIGSTKMFVENVEFADRALTLEEVQARFAKHPAEEVRKIGMMKKFKIAGNAVNLDLDQEALDFFVGLEDLTESSRTAALDARWQLLMARKEFKEAEPLLLAKAETLKKPVPEDETLPQQNVRMSTLFDVLEALDALAENGSEKCREMAASLREMFPADAAYLVKIHALDDQMRARTLAVEEDSLANLAELKKSAQNPDAVKLYLVPNASGGQTDDQPDGSKARPFTSFKAAFEAALALQAEGKSVVIFAADGEYFVPEGVLARNEKMPETTATIRLRALKGAKPVFTGGVTLKNFQKVADAQVLERFQPAVREKILVCDLKALGITDFGTMNPRGYDSIDKPWTDLFVNGKAMELARWPNRGDEELKIGEVVPGPNAQMEPPHVKTDSETFHYDFDRPDGWKMDDDFDAYAYGLWEWEWAANTVKVKQIDRENKTIQVARKNLRDRYTFHFLNILEELDAPGEYFIDRANGLVYFYPPEGLDLNSAIIEFPVLNSEFLNLKNQKNIWFDGLTFQTARGTAVRLEGCEHVAFTNCTLKQFGCTALIVRGGKYCGIFDSLVRNVGACGVQLFGGNRDTLEHCGHAMINNVISDFSRIDRAYAPAAHVIGVGMACTQNLMYDSPHHAIRAEGNDLLIARNEVHSVVYEFSDQSGIDVYCDPTYRGMVIDQNLWHHIGSSFAFCGQAGIRLDDSISGVVMTENLFYRSSGGAFGGIQIHGGKDNLIARNFFADCTLGISFSAWRNGRYEKFYTEMYPQHVKFYQDLGVYPFMETITETFNRNYVYRNEVLNCDQFVRGLNTDNIFMGNTVRTSAEAPASEDPLTIRAWLEKVSGRDLSKIGNQPNRLFPRGREGVGDEISPNFYGEK